MYLIAELFPSVRPSLNGCFVQLLNETDFHPSDSVNGSSQNKSIIFTYKDLSSIVLQTAPNPGFNPGPLMFQTLGRCVWNIDPLGLKHSGTAFERRLNRDSRTSSPSIKNNLQNKTSGRTRNLRQKSCSIQAIPTVSPKKTDTTGNKSTNRLFPSRKSGRRLVFLT